MSKTLSSPFEVPLRLVVSRNTQLMYQKFLEWVAYLSKDQVSHAL